MMKKEIDVDYSLISKDNTHYMSSIAQYILPVYIKKQSALGILPKFNYEK